MNNPSGESRSGTPEGVRVPLDARRTLQVRSCDFAPFGVLLPFSFLAVSSVPCPAVMDPALHCRIDLTKAEVRLSFFEWLGQRSGRDKRRSARTAIYFFRARDSGGG
jgi:hypothetical protein